MRKTVVCAMLAEILLCPAVYAGNIDCVKFLRFGDKKVCMKTLKETSPSLAVEIDHTVYYASTVPEKLAGIRFEYQGHDYSVYNRDDTEYELIHWLSGTDKLVNGIWHDRIAIGGALDFENNACQWNDDHTGYYSADGFKQYFFTSDTPNLDFGTDWYVEVIAQVGEPLGTSCILIDFGSYTSPIQGDALNFDNANMPGRIKTNTKPNGNITGFSAGTGDATYTWDDNGTVVFGNTRYSIDQSRAFITFGGNNYYGNPYNTVPWDKWSERFYLFRGYNTAWTDGNGFNNRYECGPTTIYDIKIWRRK